MTRWGQPWVGALLLIFVMTIPGFAQPAERGLRQEIELLKRGQQAIQQELREIKQLLQARRPSRRPAPNVSGMVFNLRDHPVKGEQTAGLTLIEFTDYQ